MGNTENSSDVDILTNNIVSIKILFFHEIALFLNWVKRKINAPLIRFQCLSLRVLSGSWPHPQSSIVDRSPVLIGIDSSEEHCRSTHTSSGRLKASLSLGLGADWPPIEHWGCNPKRALSDENKGIICEVMTFLLILLIKMSLHLPERLAIGAKGKIKTRMDTWYKVSLRP